MGLSQLDGGKIFPLKSTPPTQNNKAPQASTNAPAATRLQREAAIAALKNGADVEIEWLQVLADGAIDAVIQTQDVTALAQTVKLANAKRVTVTDVLCDAIMFMALQGLTQVIKGTIQELAESTAGAFLSTNTAFRLLPLSKKGEALTGDEIQTALNTLGNERADGKKWLGLCGLCPHGHHERQ